MIMTNAQRTNPAPAVYAAAVAIVSFGISWGIIGWGGSTSDTAIIIVLVAAVVAVVSASVVVAVTSEGLGAIVVFAAIGSIVIALDVALEAGVIIAISAVADNIRVGVFVAAGISFAVAAIVAGLAIVGVVAARRRLGRSFNPILVIVIVTVVNTVLIAGVAAFDASHPGRELSVIIDRSVYSGLHDYIWMGIVISVVCTVIILFLATVILIFGHSCRSWYRDAEAERIISVTAIGVAVIAAVVSMFITGLNIAITNAHYIDWYGQGLNIATAVAAGGVSIIGCAVTAGIAGIVAWWYRALRER